MICVWCSGYGDCRYASERFCEYSPVLDLSDVREAGGAQGYLPIARQIQGREELFGADFECAGYQRHPVPADSSPISLKRRTKNEPRLAVPWSQ